MVESREATRADGALPADTGTAPEAVSSAAPQAASGTAPEAVSSPAPQAAASGLAPSAAPDASTASSPLVGPDYPLDAASITAIGPPPWAAASGLLLAASLAPLQAVEMPARVDAIAPCWRRVAATAIDALVLAVVYAVAALTLSAAFSSTSRVNGSLQAGVTAGGDAVLLVVLVGWLIAYFTIGHGSPGGRTLGDRALGIAVRDAELGVSIGYRRALVRTCVRLGLYVALLAPGLVSDLRSLRDAKRRNIADRLAGSATLLA